jgi:hypothetical protein
MRRVSYERERPSLRTRNALRRACGLKLRRRGAHSRGRVVFGLTSAGAALLPAVSFLNYGGPSSALCFVLGDATLLVAFLDVLGHPLLLVGVTRFISTGHGNLHLRLYFLLNRQIAPSFRRKAERACPTIRKPHATVLSALSAPRTTTISTPSGSVARKTAIGAKRTFITVARASAQTRRGSSRASERAQILGHVAELADPAYSTSQ